MVVNSSMTYGIAMMASLGYSLLQTLIGQIEKILAVWFSMASYGYLAVMMAFVKTMSGIPRMVYFGQR